MGTRGAFGFRVNNEDKVTFNNMDSYPEGLGNDIIQFIRSHSLEDMKKTASHIQMIDSNIKPTKKQIVACSPWTDLTISNQSPDNWYCLLRNAQGNLDAYVDGLQYMIDSKSFLLQSLFCEFAYIINLDTQQLEFYSGFNKKSRQRKGRYASQKPVDSRINSYFGVALIWKIKLADILAASDEEVGLIIVKMQKKADGFYNRQDREMRKESEAQVT